MGGGRAVEWGMAGRCPEEQGSAGLEPWVPACSAFCHSAGAHLARQLIFMGTLPTCAAPPALQTRLATACTPPASPQQQGTTRWASAGWCGTPPCMSAGRQPTRWAPSPPRRCTTATTCAWQRWVGAALAPARPARGKGRNRRRAGAGQAQACPPPACWRLTPTVLATASHPCPVPTAIHLPPAARCACDHCFLWRLLL